MTEWAPRPDRVEGRALSPRAFRPFGIEAVMLGPPTTQEGLVRREGVAVWRRMADHGPVFDRLAATAAVDPDGLLPVRVVVAATPARDRAMRVPAVGERATRVEAAADPRRWRRTVRLVRWWHRSVGGRLEGRSLHGCADGVRS